LISTEAAQKNDVPEKVTKQLKDIHDELCAPGNLRKDLKTFLKDCINELPAYIDAADPAASAFLLVTADAPLQLTYDVLLNEIAETIVGALETDHDFSSVGLSQHVHYALSSKGTHR
jgi:hypothetical protein